MNSVGVIISKIYIAIVALFVAYLGMMWTFATQHSLDKFNISIGTLAGINTIKTLVGTSLLTISFFATLFIINPKKWFPPLLLMTTLLLVLRVLSLFIDGFQERMTIYAGLELLILFAVYYIGKNENKKS